MIRKLLAPLIVTVVLLISLLSLTSCQQCVKAHDVSYTYYTSHCMTYNSDGACLVNVPLKMRAMKVIAMSGRRIKTMKQIFLGGTCGANHWREDIVIPELLARGIDPQTLFNPVVKHWDAEAQQHEDEVKRSADYLLFVIASPDPNGQAANVSAYSLVELVMSLYDAPHRTVALFHTDGMVPHAAKAIRKSVQDLRDRFPDAPIFSEYAPLLDWLEVHLK